MKKLFSVLLVALLVAGLMTSALAGSADGKKIALVGKSAGNAFFEIAAAAFVEAGEGEGAWRPGRDHEPLYAEAPAPRSAGNGAGAKEAVAAGHGPPHRDTRHVQDIQCRR